MRELQMTDDEVTAWIEAGLQCDGVKLDDWEQDAIVRYGRELHRLLLDQMHELRMQNSAQEAIIERLKLERDTHKDAFRYMYFIANDLSSICRYKFANQILESLDECYDQIVNTLGREHAPQRN